MYVALWTDQSVCSIFISLVTNDSEIKSAEKVNVLIGSAYATKLCLFLGPPKINTV